MVFELLDGIQIELEYTIGAKKELLNIFGSNDKLAAAFAVDNDVDLAENASKIGAAMAKAAYLRQKAQSDLLGTEITARVIDWETIFQLLDDEKTLSLVNAITATIKEANDTKVQVKAEKKETAER